MNGMFWDQVICDAKIEETTEKGNKTFTRCDGVMLPIKTHEFFMKDYLLPVEYWKCHKCLRRIDANIT